MEKRYQLRYAAGIYWLIDMYQRGPGYRKPVAMNHSGARIWKGLAQGQTPEEIVEDLSLRYGMGPEELQVDVEAFVAQLRSQGILTEGE